MKYIAAFYFSGNGFTSVSSIITASDRKALFKLLRKMTKEAQAINPGYDINIVSIVSIKTNKIRHFKLVINKEKVKQMREFNDNYGRLTR